MAVTFLDVREVPVVQLQMRPVTRGSKLPAHSRVFPLFVPALLPPRIFQYARLVNLSELAGGFAIKDHIRAAEFEINLDQVIVAHPTLYLVGPGQGRPYTLNRSHNVNVFFYISHGVFPIVPFNMI